MKTLKLTSWNVAHLNDLLVANPTSDQTKRLSGVIREITLLDPDILCLIEGPQGEAKIDAFTQELLPAYQAVKATNGQYGITGDQWIWFLVKKALPYPAELLPVLTWQQFTGGTTWKVNFWGVTQTTTHKHFRQPQVMQMIIEGQKVEFMGVHFKSKFVNQGQSLWKNPAKRQEYINKALEARIKMATEATNVRAYIDKKFEQLEKPAIFVMGDFNDGPGKELFERRYLFFDLISNVEGDIFSANRSLNHALFDYPDGLRWSVMFKDFTDQESDNDPAPQTKRILLDHIMFTQALVNQNLTALTVAPHAGLIEHEVHDFVNASLNSKQKTSDHRPVSVLISVAS